MKSKERQKIANLAAARFQRMQEQNDPVGTGREDLRAILGVEEETTTIIEKPVRKIVLYLREGLKGVERNWTKYPNKMHQVMAEHLTEYESILYVNLWRESWGYGRNYCRHSYRDTLNQTTIKSLSTTRRATAGLKKKKFIIPVLTRDDVIDVNKTGTLYRIITPNEIMKNEVDEGVSLDDIPDDGVFCESMVIKNSVLSGHSQTGQGGVFSQNMVTGNIEGANSITEKNEGDPVLTEHGQSEHPLKEERFKDTLSPREIVSGFYKRIGQQRVAKAKREKAEKVIQELLADEYSLEDIQFTAEWIPENAKEDLYDFSIIEHTIGQAMAAKQEIDAREEKKRQADHEAELDRLEKQKMESEREEIEAHKAELNSNERAELRKRALEAIRNTDGIKEDFISEVLIEAKENEFLKREM